MLYLEGTYQSSCGVVPSRVRRLDNKRRQDRRSVHLQAAQQRRTFAILHPVLVEAEMHGSRIRLHPHQGPPTHSAPSIRTTDSIASADPVSKGQTCYALGVDSSRCYLRVQEHYHKYCPRHNKELRKSTDEYKTKEREAKNIEKEGQYRESEQQVQNLISIKEDIVKLRGQVQFRFFSRAADNLGHSQRILKLQDEIRSLVAERQSLQENRGLKSSTGAA